MNEAMRAEYEAKCIRDRLDIRAHAYLIRPAGIAVAQEMVRRGEISGYWGTGKDAGIFIVSRSKLAARGPGPSRGSAA